MNCVSSTIKLPILMKNEYHLVTPVCSAYTCESSNPDSTNPRITNTGYIKWKPAHLNTVDFMIVPNQNLEETVGRRVLDLYLAARSEELERYTRQFYTYAVVS